MFFVVLVQELSEPQTPVQGARAFSVLNSTCAQKCVENSASVPKDPCTQIVYTLAPKYQYRDYLKA